MKNRILALTVVVLAVFVSGCKLQTPQQRQNSISAPENPISVSLYIDCKTTLDKLETAADEVKKVIPDDGVLLAETEFEIEDGGTVYDLLTTASVQKDFKLAGTDSYISSLFDLAEFDFGGGSGWQYYVNGEFVTKSVAERTLAEGDKVEFLYTCDLGEDLKQEKHGS